LQDSFQLKKDTNPEFTANGYAQLDWLFKRSEHFEEAYMQYPVYRVMKDDSTSSSIQLDEN
jgi:hypothetical protein